jgi:hypothetical protein
MSEGRDRRRNAGARTRPAHFGPPKTKSSIRTVPASEYVLGELGEHVGRRHDGLAGMAGPVSRHTLNRNSMTSPSATT